MGTPFMGELKMISWNFPPKGWAFANGQLLPINQNQPLFSLFGTMYGGDGRVNFALPDMRGRLPIHVGAGFTQGQVGGEVAHTVTKNEMPAHTHFVNADTTLAPGADGNLPGQTKRLAGSSGGNLYGSPANLVAMNANTVSNTGGSQPHLNTAPYLVINYCVALQGVFPSRN
jgi:microcystin-dependent protein